MFHQQTHEVLPKIWNNHGQDPKTLVVLHNIISSTKYLAQITTVAIYTHESLFFGQALVL